MMILFQDHTKTLFSLNFKQSIQLRVKVETERERERESDRDLRDLDK